MKQMKKPQKISENMQNQLDFIHELVEFGKTKLNLEFGDSFSEYSEEHTICNWLYVCYPDKFQSALPNSSEFLFFWKEEEAKKQQKIFNEKGFHTYLYQAEGHGGENCPITDGLINATKARQAYVVLHEGWHITVRHKSYKMSYPFEESSGRALGLVGAILFALEKNDKQLHLECCNQLQAWKLMSAYINQYRAKLKYGLLFSGEQKQQLLFDEINTAAQKVVKEMPESWERHELNRQINFAFILRNYSYTKYFEKAMTNIEDCGSLTAAMKKWSKKHASRFGVES